MKSTTPSTISSDRMVAAAASEAAARAADQDENRNRHLYCPTMEEEIEQHIENQLSRSAVQFLTDAYMSSHGKMPRGRGGWMFCPSDKWNHNDYLAHCVKFNGTFAEAKNEARDFFAVRGIQFVTVCS